MTLANVEARTKEGIRERALALGFAACGFTSAEQLGSGPLLSEWLANGRHGSMAYLARDVEQRLDPRRSLSSASSVIVTAWPYAPPPQPRGQWQEALVGRIAAYALGVDYHEHLTAALEELAAFVVARCGGATRVHVDAGPLVEKDLARRAGLGWFGRNTNILTTDRGSYLLLACLLTEARFEPDPPFEAEHCGDCDACIPACPTGALSSGPTIDAPRCIAYLTIEHRGPIPLELRPLLGNWVFGCDICQQVCPWNAEAGSDAEFLSPALAPLLSLGREEFHDLYAKTAVARAKRRGLARNAAVALGNSRNPTALGPLENALASHDEALVRAHAAWALGHIGTRQALRALEASRRTGQVPPVAAEIDSAIRRCRREESARHQQSRDGE